MTDLAPTANSRSLLAADPRTQSRNRAEARFKTYGLSAVVIALIALALLLVSIFGNGTSAFFQTKITIPVELTEAKLDKSGTRDLDVMKKVTTIGYSNLLGAALIDEIKAQDIAIEGLSEKDAKAIISASLSR